MGRMKSGTSATSPPRLSVRNHYPPTPPGGEATSSNTLIPDHLIHVIRNSYAGLAFDSCNDIAPWRVSRAVAKKYGLTRGVWEAIFAAQGFCCAICRGDDPGGQGWSTDHDHETGAVRGILCNRCNAALGMIGDTEEALQAWAPSALRYFREVTSETARVAATTDADGLEADERRQSSYRMSLAVRARSAT